MYQIIPIKNKNLKKTEVGKIGFLFETNETLPIIEAIIQFVKLIAVTDQGNFKADYSFGFRLLDYEYESNIIYELNKDLQPVIQNKTTVLKFLAQQMEELLFEYFPESRKFIERIEVKIDNKDNKISTLFQRVIIVILFKTPQYINRKRSEEFKICLNTLRTFESNE